MTPRIRLGSFLSAVLFAMSAVAAEDDVLVRQTDLAMPPTPAFALLGVTPDQVNQPGTMRDFKLDWVIKDGGFAPNVAIEAQPVWLAFFGHTNATEYRALPWIARTASTLSASLGTAQHGSGDSGALAWGARLNLFRQADPMMSVEYADSVRPAFADAEKLVLFPLQQQIQQKLDYAGDSSAAYKSRLKAELARVEGEIENLRGADRERRENWQANYEAEHWNDAVVELGGGMVWDYASPSLDSLQFSYSGMGVWLSGCLGVTARGILTGMYRLTQKDDSLRHSVGLNFRYGGPKLSGFVELVSGFDDLGAPTIGYGGDYRLLDQLVVQFGCRTAVRDGITLSSFRPRLKFSVIAK